MSPDQVTCAVCQTANDADAEFCKKCGDPLKYACPNCGAKNWTGAEDCASCGHDLDPISFMNERRVRGFKSTLEEQRKMAGSLKAEEEESSRKRLGEMWETEKRRQEFLARQKARQDREQTILFIGLIAIVVIVIVVVGVFFLFFAK
ncbi:MAG: zinc ribbon domain-containing protein [Chloroflexi bacterium]|nr:zinc ribbon domain-containing protein [Chloroflexota bacterium]